MSDGPNPANDRVAVARRGDGRWDWHRYDATNGEQLSASSQGYESPEYALAAAKAYNVGVQRFDIVEDTE